MPSPLVKDEFICFVRSRRTLRVKKIYVVKGDTLTHKKMSVFVEGKEESWSLNIQTRPIHRT